MKPFSLNSILMIFFVSFLANYAHAAGRNDCVSSAANMSFACIVDSYEELNIHIANCKNIDPGDERTECRREAFRAQREEREGCDDQHEARLDACDVLNERRYHPDPLLDPSINFIPVDEIGDTYEPNPYFNLQIGQTSVLRAGEDFEETIVITVTEEVREIQGVDCRVVVDAVVESEEDEDGNLEYNPVEITRDWYAQDDVGNVYYCGEASADYDDGIIESIDGSFEAGRDLAKAGTLIRSAPVAGEAHRQEFALDDAEDIIQYLDLATSPDPEEGGENPSFPCNDGCLKTLDFQPLEPESTEFKYYLHDIGFVLAVAMEDGEITGEREELVCTGDSLDILTNDDCGIEDLDALLDDLCGLAPEAFCD